LNIYDLLYHEKVVISESAIKELEQLLGPKTEADGKNTDAGDAAPETSDAFPTAVNSQITDSVTESNVKVLGDSEAEPAKPKRARKPKAEAVEAAAESESEASAEASSETEVAESEPATESESAAEGEATES
jgi:ribonuclease E